MSYIRSLPMPEKVPFNRPFVFGTEFEHVHQAIASGHMSGNGPFTKSCQKFFETRFGVGKALFTSSCTDALEMAAILLDIGPGDEVIVPSFTFVSTANAFALRGATLRFADSLPSHPNLDPNSLATLISAKTKAIVIVHYAGFACNLARIREIAGQIPIIEDCAHSIDASYYGQPLGTFGRFATFSFHETKNLSCGEGGMLAMNDPVDFERGEIIWEKGTNRAAFWRGIVSKYDWIDLGSSFLGSDLNAAFLWAQIERIDDIQSRRVLIWNRYYNNLRQLEAEFGVELPSVPSGSNVNGHIFYIVTRSFGERLELIQHLIRKNIYAVSHYLPLNDSPFALDKFGEFDTPYSRKFADRLLRLPLFYDLSLESVDIVSSAVLEFYRGSR